MPSYNTHASKPPYAPIDVQRVARDFSRATGVYETYAKLQYHVMAQLFELSRSYIAPNAKVLDAGCGTGWLADLVWARGLVWQLYGVDVAAPMCEEALNRGVLTLCGNVESLSLADASLDVVFSSLCVQWLNQPQFFMHEAYRVLKPGGIMALATLGEATLQELRAAFAESGEDARVMESKPARFWESIAVDAGFTLRHSHSLYWHYPYPGFRELCVNLRRIGAMNKRQDRSRGLLGRQTFAAAEAFYHTHFMRPDAQVLSSWQPLLFILTKPAA